MKSNSKTKIIKLMILGLIFTLSPIINNYLNFNAGNSEKSSVYGDYINLDKYNLKISEISGKIHISGNSGWVDFKNAGKCTGQGTYSDPYVIEDLVIDSGGSGSCILIENSDIYFRIENCTLYNSVGLHGDAGIQLSHVTNSKLINNDCSSNDYGILLDNSDNNTVSGNNANNNHQGIFLKESDYNTVSGNIANDNYQGIYLDESDYNTVLKNNVNNNFEGIYLYKSDYNTISGNNASYNRYDGIYLYESDYNTFLGNIMNECGLYMYGSFESLGSHEIDTTNLVNGKPLYYYSNEVNLGPNDFTSAGQVILINCHDSIISNLNISYTSTGISLFYSNNNTISSNTANNSNEYGIYLDNSDYNTISGNNASYNRYDGIYLDESDYNTISGNIFIGNYRCWEEVVDCEGNIFENNKCVNKQAIPGYNLFFLLGIISIASILINKKLNQT